MAYLDTRRSPSTASIAAVVAIHGAVGAALIFGLSVTGIIPEERMPIPTWDIAKPPPPPDIPDPEPSQAAPRDRKIVAPTPPFVLPTAAPTLDTTPKVIPTLPPLPPGRGEELVRPIPSVAPSFAPEAARPRNDPANWVGTEDYRSNWIRQEMTGRTGFRLEIAADGRVAGCTITRSSGHGELDAATCALVTRRARFQPARGTGGEPVAGTYSNAIDWQLPE